MAKNRKVKYEYIVLTIFKNVNKTTSYQLNYASSLEGAEQIADDYKRDFYTVDKSIISKHIKTVD